MPRNRYLYNSDEEEEKVNPTIIRSYISSLKHPHKRKPSEHRFSRPKFYEEVEKTYHAIRKSEKLAANEKELPKNALNAQTNQAKPMAPIFNSNNSSTAQKTISKNN